MNALAQKLHPSRYTAMSPKMAAIVAYILGEVWTDPHLTSLAITSDGHLIGRDTCQDYTTGGVYLGTATNLENNIRRLLAVAGLTTEELAVWCERYHLRIYDWRRVPALS